MAYAAVDEGVPKATVFPRRSPRCCRELFFPNKKYRGVFAYASLQSHDSGNEFLALQFDDRESGGEDEIQLSFLYTAAQLVEVPCHEEGHVLDAGTPETASQIFHEGIEILQELYRISADKPDSEFL